VIDSTHTLFSFDQAGTALANAVLPTPIGNINGGGIAVASGKLYVTIGQPTNTVASFDFALAPQALPPSAFAGLSVPRGIAFDPSAAQFYVGDGAATVNVYSAAGASVTVGGGFPGNYGPSGVAFDADDDTLWVANYVGAPSSPTPTYGVAEYTATGAAAQTFDYATQFPRPAHEEPYSITVCSKAATGGSTLVVVGYIDDGSGLGSGAVRSYTTSGAMVGSFSGPLTKPYGLSCTTQGDVFIADASGLYRVSTSGANLGLPGPFAGLTPPLFGVLASSMSAVASTCPPPSNVTTLSAAGYPGTVVSDGTDVFWTDYDSIESIARDGTQATPTVVAGSRSGPFGITLDPTHVYWTENGTAGQGQVVMTSKDGTGTPTVIATNQASPRGIVFDGTNLYWTTVAAANAGGGVWTALPTAGATVTEIGAPQAMPLGIALDGNLSVYWQSYGTGNDDGTVGKWDPTTSTISTLATGQSGQYGIAVTPDNRTVYWTNYNQGTVAYTSTTASSPLATPATLATDATQNPRGIFIDAPKGTQDLVVYWTDFDEPGTVWFSKNGGNKCAISTSEDIPQGIFVDDTYVYWGNYIGSGGAIRRVAKVQ
jgi:sugar lactone lactonase YvrE